MHRLLLFRPRHPWPCCCTVWLRLAFLLGRCLVLATLFCNTGDVAGAFKRGEAEKIRIYLNFLGFVRFFTRTPPSEAICLPQGTRALCRLVAHLRGCGVRTVCPRRPTGAACCMRVCVFFFSVVHPGFTICWGTQQGLREHCIARPPTA